MRNKKILLAILLICVITCIPVNIFAGIESGGSVGGSSGDYGSQSDLNWNISSSCPWDQAIKITLYNKYSNTPIGSNFYLNNKSELDDINAQLNDKKIYIKTTTNQRLSNSIINGSWTKSKAEFKYLDFDDYIEEEDQGSVDIEDFLADYIDEKFFDDFGISDYTDEERLNLVLVVEPARSFRKVKNSNQGCYFGTYWDFAYFNKHNVNKFANHVKTPFANLKNSITISKNEISETKTPEIWNFLSNFSSFQSKLNDEKSYGVAIILYENIIDVQTDSVSKSYDCPIKVNTNECGNPSLKEPNSKKCVAHNSLYSYIPSCNIYCSESITTKFSGIYDTFKGKENVLYRAIPSGKPLEVKDSANLTITKTCYKTSKAADCSSKDWTTAIEDKLKEDYKSSEITLTVDDNNYTFLDLEPEIDIYSESTSRVVYKIKYNYEMNKNTNRYIPISTGKFVDKKKDEYKNAIIEIENEHGVIVTKKSSFGEYNYSLDLTGTKLNKYTQGSSALQNVKTTTRSKTETSVVDNTTYITTYNYTYNNSVVVNDNESGTYETSDLAFTCSYVKANPCICEKNTCCIQTTCENYDCPDRCVGECGCTCDETGCEPIDPCPCKIGEPDCPPVIEEECDPTEEVCFPNIVYRPISLTDPFPGLSGDGRTPGKNWLGFVSNEDGELIYYKGQYVTLSDYYIKYNRGYNDYDVYNAKPLYVIKLNGDTIRKIRKYNKETNHDYNDDSALKCTNGEKCISKFLRGQADGFNINLIDSGTCKDASKFNSCVTRGS